MREGIQTINLSLFSRTLYSKICTQTILITCQKTYSKTSVSTHISVSSVELRSYYKCNQVIEQQSEAVHYKILKLYYKKMKRYYTAHLQIICYKLANTRFRSLVRTIVNQQFGLTTASYSANFSLLTALTSLRLGMQAIVHEMNTIHTIVPPYFENLLEAILEGLSHPPCSCRSGF